MNELVLASTSPWRRKILEDAGIPVLVVPPQVDEDVAHSVSVVGLVEHLAMKKATAVALRHPGRWVLGADQLIHHQGEVWGKPRNDTEHLQRLERMRGETHELVTGFALLGPGFQVVDHQTTHLTFRSDLTSSELASYVATGEGRPCAGGYAVEGQGGFLVARVDGDLFNVLGLPLFKVLTAMRGQGWRFGGVDA